MIKLLRLDERLIHGQIAIKWSRHLSVNRIVVINEEAATNDLVKKSLLLTAPPNAKVAIKTMADGIELLNDPRAASLSILVIVQNPEDVLSVLKAVKGVPSVNIGNYGRVAPRQAGGAPRKTYRSNLYLYENEVAVMKDILETGIECSYQTTPEDKPEPLAKVL